jgi:hypothetical protein
LAINEGGREAAADIPGLDIGLNLQTPRKLCRRQLGYGKDGRPQFAARAAIADSHLASETQRKTGERTSAYSSGNLHLARPGQGPGDAGISNWAMPAR